MRVLFCGGGTAGHIMPAIAMAEIIEKNFKNTEILFVGRRGGNENRSIVKSGYNLETIDVIGLKRKLTPENAKAIFKAIKSSRMAKKIIFDFKPDIVIGTGGYVCYPIIRKAQKLGIANMLHESNVYPGIVTRLLGSKCTKLLLNMEGAKKHLKKTDNTIVIGNPLRLDFKTVKRDDARSKLNIGKNEILIVSFGGSLGSKVMNENIIDLMSRFSVSNSRIIHIHSTGVNNYQTLKSKNPSLASGIGRCKIVPYIDDMPTYLCACDIAISRSGAISISELAASKVASILIPSPNVAENHQYVNAKYVADKNAAILIEEKELSAKRLESTVKKLVFDAGYRKSIGEEIGKLQVQNVEENLIKAIKEIT